MSHLSCPSCQLSNQREFAAEVNIHFPGMKGLDIPTVWVFPKLFVCFDCGAAQFAIPETERKALIGRDHRSWADEAVG